MFKTLIVEDNETFRQSLSSILSAQFPDMAIAQAEDGENAMQLVESFAPDLVFMDIKLKHDNGLHLTRLIKMCHVDTVVVILTAYDTPEYREAASRAGANYFIAKGNSSSQGVLATVESILAEQGYL